MVCIQSLVYLKDDIYTTFKYIGHVNNHTFHKASNSSFVKSLVSVEMVSNCPAICCFRETVYTVTV